MGRILKSGSEKSAKKSERKQQVLVGLVETYLKTGRPVGSGTLKEEEFPTLSSATLRNYFSSLEKQGYLAQTHASGGRIPTAKGYRAYAEQFLDEDSLPPYETPEITTLREGDSRQIHKYLQTAAETLSQLSDCAIFLASPRFDHDFVKEIKIVPVDAGRALSILITDFGVIHTELLHLNLKVSTFSAHRLEQYFHYRLIGNDEPENLSKEEREWAQRYYNELMVRHVVGYANFIDEDIYRTGFAALLRSPEFHDPQALARALSLFENPKSMRLLLRECSSSKCLKFWIGEDLHSYSAIVPECAVLAIPYFIHRQPVGAIGLLGTMRIPYRELFALMKSASDAISDTLTKNLVKFQISYRQSGQSIPYLQKEERRLLGQSSLILIEDHRTSKGES